MTVREMRERMSNDELLRWSVFYARRRQLEELAAKRAEAQARRR